jgi:hypothetical protein
MRVLVCGGRNFDDLPLLDRTLDRLHSETPFSHVIMGDANGADLMAMFWAGANNIPHTRFVAKWEREGRAAGPIRNQAMLDHGKPDLVIAFPGGTGTADMMRRAGNAGVRVIPIGAQSQREVAK